MIPITLFLPSSIPARIPSSPCIRQAYTDHCTIPIMVNNLLKSPWTGAAGAVISCFWEAFWLVGPPVGLTQSDKTAFLLWGLFALMVSGGQAFYVLQRKVADLSRTLEEINEAKPRITPKIPGAVELVPVSHVFRNDRKEIILSQVVPFLRVRFWNNPAHPYPKAVARGVRAYVQFYHIGDEPVPVLAISGRWSESTQPPEYSPLVEKEHLLETTFGFGQVRTVDIAFIDLSTGKCYAWNNDNYGHEHFGYPKHLLQASSYVVHVRLWGEFVDETVRFTFNVKSKTFEFTQPSSIP